MALIQYRSTIREDKKALREMRPLRPKIVGNQEIRTDVFTTSDVLADYVHEIALEQLVPRIAKHSNLAVKANPKYFYYYIRKTIGRRCSCTDTAQTPEGQCPVCWGSGLVGGYDKYGTITEVIDVTYPNLTTVNVEPNFDEMTRPIMFRLSENALEGYVEARIDLRANIRVTDYIGLIDQEIDETHVIAYIRSDSETVYVPLTEQSLNDRLGATFVYIKIVLTRDGFDVNRPLFSHLFLRYKIKTDLRIIGDTPRRTESVALHEFGIYDNFNTQSIFFDNTISRFSNYDWLYRTDDNTGWKIIEVSPNRPLLINTSSMITARIIQPFETYLSFYI